ncbi:endonuclease [Nocardioides acrostichi]|uniref:Endonuclease n=1 Tax=Nocardioides acrostichi TaxID=2784339 RepID=A0A930UZA2_9ACTN|nr:endonuclease [Nocardioides acrostichi]MBF4161144.1 endonuclease [Nocardioides acrostichi]
MTLTLGRVRAPAPALVISLLSLLLGVGLLAPPTAQAAGELTVAQAISTQDGASHTVRGYVVGQPTATDTVVTSDFPNDYALAIADSAGETGTSQMLYVQIPSASRSTWGLRSNPDLLGQQIDVTGQLAAYFSHPGLKNASAFALTGSSDDTGGTGGGTGGTGGDSSYDSTYYANAMGKTGAALKSSLHTIISDQTVLSYSEVWTALKDTDEDPNNASNVIELYSGTSIAKSMNGGAVGDWNREHVWAKSHGDFGTTNGPGTDIQHLRPADVQVNGTRSNLDFDEGGSAVSGCSGCFYDADSFEPPDRVKGDVARMIFYMAVRYEGDDGFPDLEPDESTDNGTSPFMGRLSVLEQWNDEDPPDAFEHARNDKIYENWQGNRNPFIDHPEWVDAIYN